MELQVYQQFQMEFQNFKIKNKKGLIQIRPFLLLN